MNEIPSRIILIGLPGSGKTTLGEALAERLDIPFSDLDAIVEAKENTTVSDLFAAKGEMYFRKAESAAIRSWYKATERGVLATGGGAPCFEDNMNVIKKIGVSIFLDVPAHVIAHRLILTGLSSRPLFAGVDPDSIEAKLVQMRDRRLPWYKQATHRLAGDDIIVEDILELLEG